MNINNEFPSYSRKSDTNSIMKRKVELEKMSLMNLNKLKGGLEAEQDELQKCVSKLNLAKTVLNKKTAIIQKQNDELNFELKKIKNIDSLIELSKKIIEEIRFDNNNLSAGYSKKEIRKSDEDIFALIKKRITELLINTSYVVSNKVNILSIPFDHISLKEQLSSFISNNTVLDFENLIQTIDKSADKIPELKSLSHFGNIISKHIYNEKNKLEKKLIFSGNENSIAWKEINYDDKEKLEIAFNNLLLINFNNSININVLFKQAVDNIQNIITRQVLALSNKITEVGIRNTTITVLSLTLIIEPFITLVEKLQNDNQISLFQEKVAKLKQNVSFIITGIEKQNIKKANSEFVSSGIKLLIESLNFNNLEKEDLLFIRKYYKYFQSEKINFNNFTKNLSNSGFTIYDYDKVSEEFLLYIDKKSEKRNFTRLSDYFKYFKSNPEYVKNLNEKIGLLISISEFKNQLQNSEEITYLEVLDEMLKSLYINEISFSSMNFMLFLIEIFNKLQDSLKIQEKLISVNTKVSEDINDSDFIKGVISEVTEFLNQQRLINERETSNKNVEVGNSPDNLNSHIYTIQCEIQPFNNILKGLLSEIEQEISNRTDFKNIKINQPYTAPKIPSPQKVKHKKELLKDDDMIDIRKTSTGKLDISEILRNLNLKNEDK